MVSSYRDYKAKGLSPVEITCAQLSALGNAGNVTPGQHYIITDYNRGTVGAATILTHGVTPNTVSWNVSVQTTFDDSAWAARFDPDTCRIVDMFDNRGNKVRSDNGDEIDVFPWGNALVTGNDFTDVDFNYTAGTVRDNIGHPTARIDSIGTAVITESSFESLCDVRIDSGTVDRCEVATRGRVYMTGGGQLLDSRVGEYSLLDNNSLRIQYARLDSNSILYSDGAVGRIDQLGMDRGYIDLRNCLNVNIDDLQVESYGRILGNGSASMRILRSAATEYGYFQASATSSLVASYSNVSGVGYIRSLNGGTLTVNRVDVSMSGRVNSQTTGANSVTYSHITSSGYVEFLNTTTGCLADYNDVANSGGIRFRGTSSGGSRVHRTTVRSGQVDIQDSDNVRVFYCDVTTIGYLRIRGGSDGFQAQYTTFTGYGRMLVETGSAGRVLGTHLSGTAYVRLRNHASDLRYSNFTSYFYYYLTNNTGVKQGLFGEGRQTYTEVAANLPITVTGAPRRNW